MWSPNGLLIAFLSSCGGPPTEVCDDLQLWVMEATGENARQVSPPDAQVGFLFAWHPTRELLLYSEWSGQVADLYVVAADGSSRTKLTNSDGIAESAGAGSPDGRLVAYSGAVPSDDGVSVTGGRVYVLDMTTGISTAVSPENKPEPWGQGNHSDPIWWPDGQKVMFANSHIERTLLWRFGCGLRRRQWPCSRIRNSDEWPRIHAVGQLVV